MVEDVGVPFLNPLICSLPSSELSAPCAESCGMNSVETSSGVTDPPSPDPPTVMTDVANCLILRSPSDVTVALQIGMLNLSSSPSDPDPLELLDGVFENSASGSSPSVMFR